MKRDFLTGLGLDKDITDKIMAEYGKDVENIKNGFADYDSVKELASKSTKYQKALEESSNKLAEKDKEINALSEKIKGYENENLKIRLASESGLSYRAVQFLNGNNEGEIKQSVENLKGLMGENKTPPLANLNDNSNNGQENQYQLKGILDSLLKKG